MEERKIQIDIYNYVSERRRLVRIKPYIRANNFRAYAAHGFDQRANLQHKLNMLEEI